MTPSVMHPLDECFERGSLFSSIVSPPITEDKLSVILGNCAKKVFKTAINQRVTFDVKTDVFRGGRRQTAKAEARRSASTGTNS